MKKIIFSLVIGCAIILMGFTPARRKFTIVLVPDTQHYTDRFLDSNTYNKQMNWIVANKSAENIKFVISLGDITENDTHIEWNVARNAVTLLDNAKIPYSMVPGNHDYPGGGSFDNRNSGNFNQYFGPQWYNTLDYQSWYGGHMGQTNDNNYCFFEAGDLKFMILSLEFAPRKEVLCWADQIIRNNRDRRVIIATHCYQNADGAHKGGCSSGYGIIGSSGKTIWKEFVRRHSNIFMVVSGHVTGSKYHQDTGVNGNVVHEILTDYQGELNVDKPYGNGWMKTLTFDPDEDRVSVKTFTVLSSFTEFNLPVYNEDPNSSDHKYSFSYNMTSPLANNVESNYVSAFSDMTVNTVGAGQQKNPKIAVAKNGDYVVVWEDDSQNPEGVFQLYARGFYKGGCEKFKTITVNMDYRGQQLKPKLSMADDGSFVVVWEDDSDGNGLFQIKAARFTAMGVKKSMDFTVNTNATRQQRKPDVAVAFNGDFVIVWEDDSNGGVGVYQIFARGFKADGVQKFAAVTVNGNGHGQQLKPAVAIDANGKFVVAWEDDNNGNGLFQILAARFNNNGVKQGSDFTVNTTGVGQQRTPAIGMNAEGRFVITWEDDSDGNGNYQIRAARYNSSGIKQGNDIAVNTVSTGQQKLPAVAVSPAGDFVIVWQDDKDTDGFYEIFGRGFNTNGSQKFTDITINTNDTGQQLKPAIGLDNQGNFIVVWEDDLNNNNYYEIVAKGFNRNGNQ
jgi:hypothetical protein